MKEIKTKVYADGAIIKDMMDSLKSGKVTEESFCAFITIQYGTSGLACGMFQKSMATKI